MKFLLQKSKPARLEHSSTHLDAMPQVELVGRMIAMEPTTRRRYTHVADDGCEIAETGPVLKLILSTVAIVRSPP